MPYQTDAFHRTRSACFRPVPRAGFPVLLGLLAAPLVAPSAAPAAAQTPAPIPPFSTELALQTMDSVWNRVANAHYDPDMGGLDWAAVRREVEPEVRGATSHSELRLILSGMVGRLGLSHFAIFGPETGAELEGAAAPDAGASGGGLAGPGLDLRLVEGRLTVTRVTEGSPAERAGVHPGWVVTEIDGVDRTTLPEGAEAALGGSGTPADRLEALFLPSLALASLQGTEGSVVEVVFLDADEEQQTLTLDRVAPPGELVRFGYLPPLPVRVSDRRLPLAGPGAADAERTAAYLHFSAWFPAVTAPLAEAVDRHREAGGFVLDLRGNPGGVGGMAMGVAGHFVHERLNLGVMKTRDTELNFMVAPQRVNLAGERVIPFDGPVAILIDALSGSTSEVFAAGLQALGRARIFGEASAGQVLPAVIIPLPNGDRLMHPIADYTAPGDLRLEGRGVIPDEEVAPTRAALLSGQDPALDRALRWLSESREP